MPQIDEMNVCNLFFSFLFIVSTISGGYGNFISPSCRRLSCSHGRYSVSGKTQRIDDYFIESDGDEADDEFDRINNRIDDYNETPRQYQLSIPHRVSDK